MPQLALSVKANKFLLRILTGDIKIKKCRNKPVVSPSEASEDWNANEREVTVTEGRRDSDCRLSRRDTDWRVGTTSLTRLQGQTVPG